MVGVVSDMCYVSRDVICFISAGSFNLLLRIYIMRNLTPHAIVISVAGTVEIIQPSGTVARVTTSVQVQAQVQVRVQVCL